MLASARLTEEGVECIVSATNSLVTRHLTIWLDTMLQAEEFPACVADLHACLANVDAKCLTHFASGVFSNALLLCEEAAASL